MTIHKEGFRILGSVLLILIALNAGIYFLVGSAGFLLEWTVALSVILFFFFLNFFRSPKRVGFIQKNAIVAPADGKIVAIEETDEPEFLKGRCIQVSIFMSVFNVHINWMPVSGLVKYCRHHSGRFLAAYLPKSSTENERTTVALETESGKIIVIRQIAGALARRIVCYPVEGKKVDQGAQMGFIKFGSRVDVFLPLGSRVDVKLNQEVKGRQTILGWLD